MNEKNLPIDKLSKEIISKIKMIVFDVDGVIVPKGTKIKQDENSLMINIKKIPFEQIAMIKELYEKGFHLNISSGRGLYMLQNMFREVLPFVSLTFENGSATWHKGKIHQHINSFEKLKEVHTKLIKVKDNKIKGFEPKEFIITIHCTDRVEEIEKIISNYKDLYGLWNGEAYDIGIKSVQTKALGVESLMELLKLNKEQVMAIGDNYNDKELLEASGITISADKEILDGNFYIALNENKLPAHVLMNKILSEI
jgi:HAD superfamily hydrolase (TIGR01484 family)|tara:strand:+ start:2481 stop:3242 length:762 start_codon:yes stop_codon:yes gene_type:complete